MLPHLLLDLYRRIISGKLVLFALRKPSEDNNIDFQLNFRVDDNAACLLGTSISTAFDLES